MIDRDKTLAMASAADVPPGNLWILSDKTDFHEKPDAASPVIETLPAHSVVPFVEGSVDVPDAPEAGGDDPGWYSVALPSGKLGYASDDASPRLPGGQHLLRQGRGPVDGHGDHRAEPVRRPSPVSATRCATA